MNIVNLDKFENKGWSRGRPLIFEALWSLISRLFVSSSLPGSLHRRILLRLFGAKLGKRVVIKPRVQVKFPWRLQIGDFSWIGERVWIDNLAEVHLGSNVCLSQGAYLCTGSHDWSSPEFDLVVRPIAIQDEAWIAAQSTIGPGVTVGRGAVLGLGAVATKDLDPWTVYAGNPAIFSKNRKVE